MARYYFHLWNGSKFEIDDVGVELAVAEHAYLEACTAAREIARDLARTHEDAAPYTYLVLDQRGRTVFEVPFAEVLAPEVKTQPKASLEQQRRRSRILAGELAAEVERARRTIAQSKALVSQSRLSETGK